MNKEPKTVDEMKAEKEQLQKLILEKINAFESKYKTSVDDIDLTKATTLGGYERTFAVSLRVYT